jgi:hypothetical protein
VITPLLAICSPVSAGVAVPDPYSRLRTPLAVVGAVAHRLGLQLKGLRRRLPAPVL